MKLIVALLLSAIVATGAMAQIDDDSNMIGIYFDLGATVVHSNAYGENVGYIIATNCTYTHIYAWDAAMYDFTSGSFNGYVYGVELPAGVEGLSTGAGSNIDITFTSPLPVTSTAVVIGEFNYSYYLGGSCLKLGPSTASGLYPSMIPGQIAMQVGPNINDVATFGDSANGGYCATIGTTDCIVVSAETTNFSTIKALYR